MRKTELKQKTPLKAKTNLKATTKKRPKQTIPALTKKADAIFSRYVRLRDSYFTGTRWVGECITCNKKLVVMKDDAWNRGVNLGHFIGRGTKELRYDEFNCNLQCAHCNAWADKEKMQENYRKGIALKYGESTLKELKKRAEIIRTNTRDELEEVIHDYTVEVKHMLDFPDLYRK